MVDAAARLIRGKHRAWVMGGAIAAIAVVGWSLLPWEWSLIDDPGFAISVRQAVDEHGLIAGLAVHSWEMFQVDLTWGLFRPAYWVYPSLVYILPIGPAHAVRLLMLAVAVIGPAVAVRRTGARWPLVMASALIVVTSTEVLSRGLFNVSLQELSGAAFVGLGLMAASTRWRIAAWLVAACFKAPFAWILVGESIALWRRGERGLAAVAAGLATVTLVAGFLFARDGTYTSGYTDGALGRAIENVPALASPTLALVAVGWLWWLILSRSGVQWSSWSLAFAVGAGGYALQVLPWSLAGHYPGPIYYLAAVLAVSTLRDPGPLAGSRVAVALLVPGLVAALSLGPAVRTGLGLNATLRGISECVVQHGKGTVALSPAFGVEGVVRIPQNVELRSPEWPGTFVVPDDEGPAMLASSADLLVASLPVDDAVAEGTRLVCDLPYAQVLRPVQE